MNKYSGKGAVPKITRSATNHWFFGKFASDMSDNYLPLKIEAIRLYLFKRHEIGQVRFSEKEKNAIINEITSKFIQIWTKASLPVKSEKAVCSQIKKEIFEIIEVVKKKNSETVSENWKTEIFKKYKLEKMLDICSCNCFINSPKSEINLDLCSCDASFKIPSIELEFYIDQKFERNFMISSYRKTLFY